MNIPDDLLPGDVIAVDTGDSWSSIGIRVGQLLERRSWSWVNHVIMFHHVTDRVRWGIQGQPGGVGWVDLSRGFRHLTTNAAQPKTAAQRTGLCAWGETVLGTRYDWSAIEAHTMEALGIPDLWKQDWHGQGAPAHVVCSSVWAAGYDRQGLARPLPTEGGRYVTPADWDRFNR